MPISNSPCRGTGLVRGGTALCPRCRGDVASSRVCLLAAQENERAAAEAKTKAEAEAAARAEAEATTAAAPPAEAAAPGDPTESPCGGTGLVNGGRALCPLCGGKPGGAPACVAAWNARHPPPAGGEAPAESERPAEGATPPEEVGGGQPAPPADTQPAPAPEAALGEAVDKMLRDAGL